MRISIRIVHRDLKSQNVIYQEAAAMCKLCDFGLARLMPPGYSELDPAHLGTGGTPAYQVSPETLHPKVMSSGPHSIKTNLFLSNVLTHNILRLLHP